MQLYESIVQDWGRHAGIPIQIGNRQCCRIEFPNDKVVMQIDLDPTGERIVLGAQLGVINPSPYRLLVFKAALKVNGFSASPRGVLSFSDRLNSLMLHQFLSVATASTEKLDQSVLLFRIHAKAWVDAIKQEAIPTIEEERKTKGSGMFGMSP